MNASGYPQTKKLADLVLKQGRIYTVNGRQPWAEAVAIRDGHAVLW